MPQTAQVRRERFPYRIGELGRGVLLEGAAGESRRSRLSVEDQDREYAVLNYLEDGEAGKPTRFGARRGRTRHCWREGRRRGGWCGGRGRGADARRVERVAVLVEMGGLAPNEGGGATHVSSEILRLRSRGGRRAPRDGAGRGCRS